VIKENSDYHIGLRGSSAQIRTRCNTHTRNASDISATQVNNARQPSIHRLIARCGSGAGGTIESFKANSMLPQSGDSRGSRSQLSDDQRVRKTLG
jgi:hypothetical protein